MASATHHPDSTAGNTLDRAPARPGMTVAGSPAVGLAVALAAGAAILTLGRFVEDPAAAAEATYLASLTVLLLACAAVLGARARGSGATALLSQTAVPWTALAVVTAAWVLPPGPGRGAVVLALLVAGVAAAAAGTRWTPVVAPAGRQPTTLAATLHAAGAVLPLAVAVQVVFRGEHLLSLALDAHTLVVFLVMPLAVALKVAFLAVRRGAVAAGLAAATVVLWTGGLNVAATVAFLGLAAGELLRDPGVASLGRQGFQVRGLLVRACAVAVLIAPFAWQPRTAAVAAAAGLLTTGNLVAVGVVAAAAVAAVLLAPLQSWPEAARLLGLGLLLLPLLPRLAGHRVARGARRALTVAAGLALAVAAARCAPALALANSAVGDVAVPALAAPLALLAIVAVGGAGVGAGRSYPGLALQRLWSGGLLLAAGLASAYPWLRPDAAATVLAALGLHPDGVAPVTTALTATVAAAALGAFTGYLARRAEAGGPDTHDNPGGNHTSATATRLTGWAVLATALVAVLLLATRAAPEPPFGRTLVGHPGILLSAAEPRVETTLAAGANGDAPREIRRLALVGSLVRAEGVADGTTVATVTVLAGDRPLATWPLIAGQDLGEWAARRPAVAAALNHRPPPPWASWVAPGGDYLGQVYRARHDARTAEVHTADVRGTTNTQPRPGATDRPAPETQTAPAPPLRLVLQRDPNLPPTVQVHVRRLEAWP